MKELKVKVQEIDINLISENVGQIPDVPANPRTITDESFELLKKSIYESPEMQEIDEVKVFFYDGKYIAIGGNHRLRAYKEMGWKKVLCKVIPKDTPPQKLREYIMKENIQYAQNDFLKLDSWNQEELQNWGVLVMDEWDELPYFEDTKELGEPKYGKSMDIRIKIPIEKKQQKEEIKQIVIEALQGYGLEIV